MAIRTVVGVSAVILAVILMSNSGVLSSLIGHEMVEEVNARLPEDARFDPMWWYVPKAFRLYQAYKRLCPNGRLLTAFSLCAAVGAVSLLVAAWAIGFMGR
jgi:hypothetical protein